MIRSVKLSNKLACSLNSVLKQKMATKIGVVQMQATSDKLSNFQQASKYIKEAKIAGAKMVFLPECFDFIGSSREETLSIAENLTGELLSSYRKLASEENLWLSLGGAHLKRDVKDHDSGDEDYSATEDDRIFNTHVIINSDGEIVQTYAKVHLFDINIRSNEEKINTKQLSMLESRAVRAGKHEPPVVINTPVGTLGLAICYDMRFPELASHLRYAKGAQVLTYPSAFTVPTGEAGHWHILLRARAIENQCYVVAAAQVGKHNEKRSSYGHSLVVDPWGQILAEMKDPIPGLMLCDIGPFQLDKHESDLKPRIFQVRQSLPVEYHRRFDLFPMSDSGHPRPISSQDFKFGPHVIKSNCVFYQSELSFAFVNISPLVPGHILVCPIKCKPRFDDLKPAQLADLYLTVKQISSRLANHYQATSLTVSIQDGVDAGQSVPHVHVHVLPRKPNDFPHNDDIYQALQDHDKLKTRIYRTEHVMCNEANELRQLYYSI